MSPGRPCSRTIYRLSPPAWQKCYSAVRWRVRVSKYSLSMKSLGRGALALLMFTPRLANAVTWGEARALVVRDAPELLAAERRRQIAAAEIDVAGTVANPTFAVTTARETARLSTSVSLPLPLFGQRGAAVRTANANAQIVAAEG